jgi:hypothetical protein
MANSAGGSLPNHDPPWDRADIIKEPEMYDLIYNAINERVRAVIHPYSTLEC